MNTGNSDSFLYISSHDGPEGAGVYSARFDLASGECSSFRKASELERAGLIVRHPSEDYLYVVGVEGHPENNLGCVAAYAVDSRTGALTLLNKLLTGAGLPTFITVAPDGKLLFQVSFSTAAGSALKIQEDGSLIRSGRLHTFTGAGPNKVRQISSRPHCMNIHPTDDVVYVSDLGADQFISFRLDREQGELLRVGPPQPSINPGAGPRIMRFSDDGRHAYVLNELDSTVSIYCYESASQHLEPLQVVSTLPGAADGNFQKQMASELRLHPNQKYVYASNRSAGTGEVDGMVVFERDTSSEKLTPIQHYPTGKHPRHFNMDPDGKWLLASARDADRIHRFHIDQGTGRLSEVGAPLVFRQPWDIHLFNSLKPES